LLIILIIFFLDRFTKISILNNLSDSTFYLNDFINFDLIWNTGIGFGLLSSNSNFFYNSTTTLIGFIIIFLLIFALDSGKYEKIIFSTIIGGALGNFYDRIIFKAVPDFIDLHYKNFHWFTFNLADIFITIGLVSMLIYGLILKDK
jgi:signal peptidase II